MDLGTEILNETLISHSKRLKGVFGGTSCNRVAEHHLVYYSPQYRQINTHSIFASMHFLLAPLNPNYSVHDLNDL